MSDTKGLTKLGAGKTDYATTPSKDILETFENQHKDSGFYLVPFTMERDEFTSLCPKTGQPDQARMEVIYIPNKRMVESKSLKLYFFSFRNTGEFHEDVVNRIADDLEAVLNPSYLRVYGDFAPRGGLAMVERWDNTVIEDDRKYKFVRDMVAMFDLKK
jgi:7-cyano-7-deazaguanine reductase